MTLPALMSRMRILLAAQRRRPRLALLSGYSRFVGLMKVALPATAAALLGLIFVWPHLARHDKAFRLAFASVDARTLETLTMANPRYYGTDDKNMPYHLTADSGTEINRDAEIIALERPVANLSRGTDGNVLVNSDTGFFYQKENTLDLIGHVDLYEDGGYEVHTHSAKIDVDSGSAAGNEPTFAKSAGGTIEGEGFKLWNRGERILFTGKAKAVFAVSKSKT